MNIHLRSGVFNTSIAWTLVFVLIGSSAMANSLNSRDVFEIWPNGVAPGSEHSPAELKITERSQVAFWPDRILTGITRSNLTAFVPDHPNGTAVVVAPGGAYGRIVLDKEAAEMARWLNPLGITVFLMQYRLPAEGHDNGKDAPLADAQRAIRFIRQHAKEWNLNPNKIGMLGSSAAGHMTAMLGAQFNKIIYPPIDDMDRLSARPDFVILMYPVISMDTSIVNMESRNNLLGKDPSPELINDYSADKQVNKHSPPTFIVVTEDDHAVPAENGQRYCNALKAVSVECELHSFKEGGHGFGIRDARQLPVSNWPNLAAQWMKRSGML